MPEEFPDRNAILCIVHAFDVAWFEGQSNVKEWTVIDNQRMKVAIVDHAGVRTELILSIEKDAHGKTDV